MESFDWKVFVYHCISKWYLLLCGTGLGCFLVGGGYYLARIVLADPPAYQVVDKYYIEYGTDPQILLSYSYFEGFTWNDWVSSDEWVTPVLQKLSFPLSKDELISSLKAEIKSDVRIVYLTVTSLQAERALEIAQCYQQSMTAFGKSQKELREIRLLDEQGPFLEDRDIRLLRAVLLGAIVGLFFTWFFLGFFYLLQDKLYLPQDFSRRYHLPVAGYLRAVRTQGKSQGKLSTDLMVNLDYLLRGKSKIGITPVDICERAQEVSKLLGQVQCVFVPGLLHEPQGAAVLRETEANLLLVQAGRDSGGAIEALLQFAKQQQVTFAAVLFVDVDERLVCMYRWNRRREEK